MTLTDSLQADKIAFADIYYSVDSTAKSSADDQEILKATPNAEDKTKFTVSVNGNLDTANLKVKAILTYDNEENLLDYFSSYDGVEATNGIFNVDFENSKDNEQGFGGGTGTENDPFIISAPRHFVNINKKDDEGKYLYFTNNFKQTANIDFSHLTGLKINKTEENTKSTDTTIEVINEKAPFYNEGKGIDPIGGINISDMVEAINNSDTEQLLLSSAFQGNYDGNDNIIDGIVIANPQKYYIIGLFPIIYNATIQKLTIGENSIFFIDDPEDISVSQDSHSIQIMLGAITGYSSNSTIEQCENRATISLSNIQTTSDDNYCLIYLSGISCQTAKSTIKNCKNTGHINIDNCKIEANTQIQISNIFMSYSEEAVLMDNENEGNINITNNTFNKAQILIANRIGKFKNTGHINITNNTFNKAGIQIGNYSNKFKNNGHINIDSNTNLLQIITFINQAETMNDCTNDGHITITNNTLEDGITGSIQTCIFSASSYSNCVNNGNIVLDNNSENYNIVIARNITGNATGCTNNGTVTVDGVVGEI